MPLQFVINLSPTFHAVDQIKSKRLDSLKLSRRQAVRVRVPLIYYDGIHSLLSKLAG